MSILEVARFAIRTWVLSGLLGGSAEVEIYPGTPQYIEGVAYWVPNKEATAPLIEETIEVDRHRMAPQTSFPGGPPRPAYSHLRTRRMARPPRSHLEPPDRDPASPKKTSWQMFFRAYRVSRHSIG